MIVTFTTLFWANGGARCMVEGPWLLQNFYFYFKYRYILYIFKGYMKKD